MKRKRKDIGLEVYFPSGVNASKDYEKFMSEYRQSFTISGTNTTIFTPKKKQIKKKLFDF